MLEKNMPQLAQYQHESKNKYLGGSSQLALALITMVRNKYFTTNL